MPVTINAEDQSRSRVNYTDLLNGHGSFEDAKVYGNLFAVRALNHTNTPTEFDDVLFSSGWKGWSSNSLELSNLAQIVFNNGAEGSQGMLFVTQGIHLVKRIVLHTSNEARSIEDKGVMKGLYYKLWIRGKNENTINVDLQVGLAEINSPTSFLSNKFVGHKYNEDMYEWKEINGSHYPTMDFHTSLESSRPRAANPLISSGAKFKYFFLQHNLVTPSIEDFCPLERGLST